MKTYENHLLFNGLSVPQAPDTAILDDLSESKTLVFYLFFIGFRVLKANDNIIAKAKPKESIDFNRKRITTTKSPVLRLTILCGRGNNFHSFHGPLKSDPKVTQMGTKMEPKSMTMPSWGRQGTKQTKKKTSAAGAKMSRRASQKGDHKPSKID